MFDVLNKVRFFRVEADNLHQKYLAVKRQSYELKEKHSEILRQIRSLQVDLDRAEKERQAKRQFDFCKELEERALKKLKGGERLTWEEYKILAEKGVV